MVYYHRLGRIPPKRHVVFRSSEGALYHEELMGNRGFSGISSLLYHIAPPTLVRDLGPVQPVHADPPADSHLRHRHLRTGRIPTTGDPILGREVLFLNDDVSLGVARPDHPADYLYRNGTADELIYVSHGEGVLESQYGRLPYRSGDYLVIPRGIIHRLDFASGSPQWHFIVESRGDIRTPHRYRNPHGQHLEGAPFSERDFRVPSELVTRDEAGEFEVRVKQGGQLHQYIYARHPFDVVGWDGYYYPWAFNIYDFEPIVGRLHLPPPVHQVFEGDGFVVCNFVPRLYDFDPNAIVVPYNHTNAQSDEVLFYASDRFMSRRGIEFGSITHHPDGIPHGPQPGAVEQSLGSKETDELAVMVDTFRPLRWTAAAESIEDPDYWRSWNQS